MKVNSVLLAAAVLLNGGFVAFAQNVTASIAGIARDPSGAPVPSITVIAVNEGTGARFQTTTDADGQYTVRAIPIGVYRLSAEAQGFKRFDTSGIRLQVNEVARVDINLAIGTAVETVTVAAQAVTVDTTSATLKTVVDQKRIEDLPLNGRNPTQLMRLVAGVQIAQGADVTSGTTYPGVQGVSGMAGAPTPPTMFSTARRTTITTPMRPIRCLVPMRCKSSACKPTTSALSSGGRAAVL